MRLKKNVLILLLTLTACTYGWCQEIEIIRVTRASASLNNFTGEFQFIQTPADTVSMTLVAVLKVTGTQPTTWGRFYNALQGKAREFGGNAFTTVTVDVNDLHQPRELVANIYNASDAVLREQQTKRETNVVYVFGNPKNATSFKLNKEKLTLDAGTVVRHVIKPGAEARISKGGITGTTAWITWRADKPATYLDLGGIGVGPGGSPSGAVGVSISTGSVSRIDNELGEFLVTVMNKIIEM